MDFELAGKPRFRVVASALAQSFPLGWARSGDILGTSEKLDEADRALTLPVTQRRPAVSLAQRRGEQRLVSLDSDFMPGGLDANDRATGWPVCVGGVVVLGYLLQD
jgi:hypothetical protein